MASQNWPLPRGGGSSCFRIVRERGCASLNENWAFFARPSLEQVNFARNVRGTIAIKYPITMQVHVIWHPQGDARCWPLAERIYLALNRDPHQPMLPGNGIPVFFRSASANRHDPEGVPCSIHIPDTTLDLRIALVTEDLVNDDAWMTYLENNCREVDRKPGEAILFSVDMSGGGLEVERLNV
jgi:hypothetical protein